MAEDQQVPSPTGQSEPVPVLPSEPVAPEHSTKRIAILSTLLVVLLAGGVLWFDPFGFFTVKLGENKAAPPDSISARCASNGIVVTWRPIDGETINAIERKTSGTYVPIFFENGGPPFSVTTFTDEGIERGITYEYRIFTSVVTPPSTSITCPL